MWTFIHFARECKTTNTCQFGRQSSSILSFRSGMHCTCIWCLLRKWCEQIFINFYHYGRSCLKYKAKITHLFVASEVRTQFFLFVFRPLKNSDRVHIDSTPVLYLSTLGNECLNLGSATLCVFIHLFTFFFFGIW